MSLTAFQSETLRLLAARRSPESFLAGIVRLETDKLKIESFMASLGKRVRGKGRIYFTGGATAVLHGWRPMTIDIDIKPEPEPDGLFEAIALLTNDDENR